MGGGGAGNGSRVIDGARSLVEGTEIGFGVDEDIDGRNWDQVPIRELFPLTRHTQD